MPSDAPRPHVRWHPGIPDAIASHKAWELWELLPAMKGYRKG